MPINPIEPRKSVVEELKTIQTLFAVKTSVKVHKGSYHLFKKTKFIYNKGKGYFIETSSFNEFFSKVGQHKVFNVDAKHLQLRVTDSFVNSMGATTRVKIFSFNEIKFRKTNKYYCRKIIPLEYGLNFRDFIRESVYSSNDNWRRRGILEIQICELIFHIYVVSNNLFIDCINKLDPEVFDELSWSILVGLGYITGYLPQDEEYVFFYRRKQMDEITTFKYRTLRPTVRTFYTPINSNPYAWIRDHKTAETYHYKIDNLNFNHLSRLCQLIHDSDDIKGLLLLFIESLKGSMLIMPVGLCVVLEGLSEYVYDKNSKTMKPITDKNKDNEFRKELIDVLKKYKNEPAFKNGYSIIEDKIFQINKPTNRDKLKSPFTKYGLEITAMDEEVLDYRNQFLHGNINLNPKNSKTFKMDAFEVSLRLMTLINTSLMKMIGYNGFVLNHVKIQKQNSKQEIQEDFYRSLADPALRSL